MFILLTSLIIIKTDVPGYATIGYLIIAIEDDELNIS